MGKKKTQRQKAVIPFTKAERAQRINNFFVQLSIVSELTVPDECFKRMKEFEDTGKEYIAKVQLDLYKQLDVHLVNDKNSLFYIKMIDNRIVVDDEDVKKLIEG